MSPHINTTLHRATLCEDCAPEGSWRPEPSEPLPSLKWGALTAIVAVAATTCAILLGLHFGVPTP